MICSLFPPKALIGVIHLNPLPGSPGYGDDLDQVYEACLKDANALIQGGVDGIILENFGDAPFFKNQVPPHTIALMTALLLKIRALTKIPLGVNVLRNDAMSALAVAMAGKGDFVRVNVFVHAAVTDQGVIEGQAAEIMRYRKQLGLNARVLADIQVKHGSPLVRIPIEEEAKDAFFRGGAHGLIVSGPSTGSPLNLEDLTRVKQAVPQAPLFAGSGVKLENAEKIMAIADGAIVGTSLKTGGQADQRRVKELKKAMQA